MPASRKLGPFELAQTLTDEVAPLNAVVVARLSATPSEASLRRALDRLRRGHPLLRARITGGGNHRSFRASDEVPPIPLESHARRDDDTWRHIVARELDRRVDIATGPLLRVSRVADGDGTEVPSELLFTFQHTMMDATSAVHLIDKLLGIVANGDTDEDTDEAVVAEEISPPLEDRVPRRFRGARRFARTLPFLVRQLFDEAVFALRSRPGAPPARGGRHVIASFEVAPELVRSLVRRARRERVTLHGVLAAAILRVTVRRFEDGQAGRRRHVYFADLRPYLEPPASAAELGSYFALLRLTSPVDPQEPFWPLARRIDGHITTALKRGEKYLAPFLAPILIRRLVTAKKRMATSALAYTGRLDLGTSYGELTVRGVHAFVSNTPAGPLFTAEVRLQAGRLHWDTAAFDKDLASDRIEDVNEEIHRVLQEVAAASETDLSPKRRRSWPRGRNPSR